MSESSEKNAKQIKLTIGIVLVRESAAAASLALSLLESVTDSRSARSIAGVLSTTPAVTAQFMRESAAIASIALALLECEADVTAAGTSSVRRNSVATLVGISA